jgi:hypothetical protein
VTAVLLAGALRRPPLRAALDVPELCMPLAADADVLDGWLRAFATLGTRWRGVCVVHDHADLTLVRDRLERARPAPLEALIEPVAWRGPGGVLRDVTDGCGPDDLVLAIEAARLPPRTLAPIMAGLGAADAGVVGCCGDAEPAGVILLRRSALERAPRVGYHDLKEQLLPALHQAGLAVRAVHLDERTRSLRRRREYLRGLAQRLGRAASVARDASVAAEALLDGTVVIRSRAVVESEAVLQDAVIMEGARVSRGAVVGRSVVGPGALVEPGSRLIEAVVPAARSSIAGMAA